MVNRISPPAWMVAGRMGSPLNSKPEPLIEAEASVVVAPARRLLITRANDTRVATVVSGNGMVSPELTMVWLPPLSLT